MKSRTLPTLEDVAQRTEVSTSTVSRCLNEPWRVAEPTRNRILEAVAELGYTPNFGAQALASNRTRTFGAVVPTLDNAIFARGLQAFQDELAANDATMLVSCSSYDADVEERQIRSLIARGADGLMLIGKRRSDDIYRFLESRGIPVVITWTLGKAGPWSYVGFDNARGMTAIAERAIELGHERFAILTAERGMNDRAADRVKGAQTVWRKRGLDASAMPIIDVPYDIDAASAAVRQLLERDPRPTVIMCGNDVQAVGALRGAQSLGIRVPEALSITGFDDLELSRLVDPGLTTVHVPHHEMGQMAAKVLLAQLSDDASPQRIRLPTRVVERESLARCPA